MRAFSVQIVVIDEEPTISPTSPPSPVRARTREGTARRSSGPATRVPRNAGFPPMILPINRSLVGARVERISSARALEMCLF